VSRRPALYVIGGGPLGLRTLRVARELGLALVVTDRQAGAPGLALADEAHVVDGEDAAAHAALAASSQHAIVAAMCGAEFGARAVDAVRRACGLATNGAEAVERVLDKQAMKAAFFAAGVPTPGGVVAGSAGALAAALPREGRAVVKPLGGSGSRGVQVVGPDANPLRVWEAATVAVPGERAVLVEPFVEGRSIDLNGILVDGDLHPAGLLEKYTTPAPARLPLGGHDPAALDAAHAREAYALLARAATAVGLRHGPVKGDFLLGPEGYTVLEVAPRFHGDVTTAGTLPQRGGTDPVRAYLQACLDGEPAPTTLRPRPAGVALWRVLALPPGRVLWLPDEHAAAAHPGLGLVWHRVRAGGRVRPYEDTTRIPGYVSAHGETAAEAEAALAAWFDAAGYAVEPDPDAAAWYERLVEELRALGWSPAACGVPAAAVR